MLLNSPAAPAPANQDADRGSHPLGIVPHTIREFLASFQQIVIKGQAYDSCSACSDGIVEEYKRSGWNFVKRALNEKGYVEEVSGLKEVQRMAEEMEGDIEWDEEGEGEML